MIPQALDNIINMNPTVCSSKMEQTYPKFKPSPMPKNPSNMKETVFQTLNRRICVKQQSIQVREETNPNCDQCGNPENMEHLLYKYGHYPCLALCLLNRLGEYWFGISSYVYDRNRPLTPILRQRQCSLMYDVYLTCIDIAYIPLCL
jgi:hypothetical protein